MKKTKIPKFNLKYIHEYQKFNISFLLNPYKWFPFKVWWEFSVRSYCLFTRLLLFFSYSYCKPNVGLRYGFQPKMQQNKILVKTLVSVFARRSSIIWYICMNIFVGSEYIFILNKYCIWWKIYVFGLDTWLILLLIWSCITIYISLMTALSNSASADIHRKYILSYKCCISQALKVKMYRHH